MFWEKKNISYSEKNHFHSRKLTFTPVLKAVGLAMSMECAMLWISQASLQLYSDQPWTSNGVRLRGAMHVAM